MRKRGRDCSLRFFRRARKRGQFFILASVILALLMFSMAFTANYVIAHNPDSRFFDYADTIEREADSVIDYQVYSNIHDDVDMEEFVQILEADFRDREIGANFLFIYGNKSAVKVKNLGTEGVLIGDEEEIVKGSTNTVESKIRVGGIGAVSIDHFNNDRTEYTVMSPGSTLQIRFNDYPYDFPLSDYNQVIFIIQKDVEDETFVEIR